MTSNRNNLYFVLAGVAALYLCIQVTDRFKSRSFTAPAPIKASMPTTVLPLPSGIKVIKPEALKKIGVVVAPTQHVTATATLPKSKGGHEVISVTDDTGATVLLSSEKPADLFGIEHSGRVGVGVGLSTRHGQSGKVFAEYTPITVLGLKAGIDGQFIAHPYSPDAPLELYGGFILYKEF